MKHPLLRHNSKTIQRVFQWSIKYRQRWPSRSFPWIHEEFLRKENDILKKTVKPSEYPDKPF